MQSREDKIINIAVEKYKEICPGKTPVILRNDTLKPYLFAKLQATIGKDFAVKMDLIEVKELHYTAILASEYIGGSGKGFPFHELEGMFKVSMSYKTRKAELIAYSFRCTIAGRDVFRNGVVMHLKDTKLLNSIINKKNEREKIKSITPPSGFQELHKNDKQVYYVPFIPKQNNTILHPSKELIRNAIASHFQYVKNHGEILKMLVYGGFGTGKTECVVEILKEMLAKNKDLNITYPAVMLPDVADHMTRCAKAKVPTIVVIEEAEHWLSGPEAKFFIGSHAEQKNKAGSLYIFITNNPSLINEGVIVRDERIDEIIPFTKEGMLQEDRITLFNLTLKKVRTTPKIKWDITDYSILSNLSGAEIIGLVKSTVRYCQLKNITIVTEEILREKSKEKLAGINTAKRYNSDKRSTFSAKVGFGYNES